MDNRKRVRLEVPTSTTGMDSDCNGLPIIGPNQSILFNGSAANTSITTMPSNVFLTICDDNSGESEEYLGITDNRLLTNIKNEQFNAQLKAPSIYQIVSQLQRKTVQPKDASVTTISELNSSTALTTGTTLLPTNVQLPSGCEIYLVKEFEEPCKLQEPTTNDVGTSTIAIGNEFLLNRAYITTGTPSIKIEPTEGLSNNREHLQVMPNNVKQNSPDKNDVEENQKGLIGENCKKRDDRRRATHNEVERRRRDKINSWIFKLKEMLPIEVTCISPSTINTTQLPLATQSSKVQNTWSTTMSSQAATTVLDSNNKQQRNNNNYRTPPCDSKSQILIKACEYIKSMQDELKSLRECLTENESLRLSNETLAHELRKMKAERKRNNSLVINPNGSNSNVTLNSLNRSDEDSGCLYNSVDNNRSSYTKRELILRDFVD